MAENPIETVHGKPIYSVSRLVTEAKALLEGSFPLLWVEGEISNLARPASGHIYFSLKDEAAQIRCAMFKNRNRLLDFSPRDGQQVLLRARVSLYPVRGEFQLVVEHMEEAGAGALRRAFEQLQKRLDEEGLFDPVHKRPIPPLPRCIGVITSGTGAALRDVLSVLRRRYPLGEVLVHPVPVQGEAAAPAIVRALETASARRDCDVLILTRGGGSLEDLWAFNEEVVARAIHACSIPVVAGVGHEVDFTIADLVADARAPTPSAAAELVGPDLSEWRIRIRRLADLTAQIQHRRLETWRQQETALSHRLRLLHPARRIELHMQRLDEMEHRLGRSIDAVLQNGRSRLRDSLARLQANSPARILPTLSLRSDALSQRLKAAMAHKTESQAANLAALARSLNNLSPLKTLERGYAVASKDGTVLKNAEKVNVGEAIAVRLHQGALDCTVTETHEP